MGQFCAVPLRDRTPLTSQTTYQDNNITTANRNHV